MDLRPVQKTIYTLNIGNYAPEICALTYPLFQAYARKIGADFHVIRERKFPDWPVVYEKLQIYELGRTSDWNIFFDGDTLVNPEMFDITEHLDKDTVCHNGTDVADIRWKFDKYFRRDRRFIGSCNWFTVGSDWCLDLWRPLDDLTLEEALQNINITVGERNSGLCTTEHLIDDYTLSRNIARFGLKVKTVTGICSDLGWRGPMGQPISPFLFHKYTISNAQKVEEMLAILGTPNGQGGPAGVGWGLLTPAAVARYREEWGVRGGQGPHVAWPGNAAAPVSLSANSSPVPGCHIQGWTSEEELRWLNERARTLESVVEIGSWKGRSTFALCSSGCPRVYAIDHFLGSSEHWAAFGFHEGWTPFPDFRRNILDCFKNVTLKRMASAEAAKDFADFSVDLIYIDGAHEFDFVLEDLILWSPKARRVVACQTNDNDSAMQACRQFFCREPDEVVGRIWVYRK